MATTPHDTNIQNSETDDLSQFGYKQQLSRTLNFFSTFGLAFSYISPVVGVYTLFGLGLCTSGPSFIWGLPIVVFGQMMVVLVFSELAVTYPLAGALYQWARHLVGFRYGWLVGWIYGWALLITVASIDFGAAPYILDFFGIEPHPWMIVLIAIVLIVIHTTLNLIGVKVTAMVTNFGLVVEVGMTLILGGVILFGPGPHQDASILFSKEIHGATATSASFLPGLLAQAFIFFGFESAADVSEEIVDAKKSVPRVMITSLTGAAIVTWFLQFALVIAIPNIQDATADACIETIPYIISAHVGRIGSKIISLLLIVAYVSCAGAVQAATARLLFSYARDDQIPGSYWFKQVSAKTQIPFYATLATAFIPIAVTLTNFIQLNDDISMVVVITTYAVIGIYMAFQSIVIARLYAAYKKGFYCAQVEGYFSLRRLSIPVACVALIYGVSMIINLLWPTTYDNAAGYISIIITAVILGSGTAIVLLFVKERAIVEPKKEEVNPLLTY